MNKTENKKQNLSGSLGIKDGVADRIIDYVREEWAKPDQNQSMIIKTIQKKYKTASEKSFANYVLGRIVEETWQKKHDIAGHVHRLMGSLNESQRSPSTRQIFMAVFSALSVFMLMGSILLNLVSLSTEGFELWRAIKMIVDVVFIVLIFKWNLEA